MGTFEVGTRELEVDFDGTVTDGDRELRFPWRFRYCYGGERLLVVLNRGSEGRPDPNVVLDDPTQTVVAVSEDCEVEWFVDPVADPGTDEFYHRDVYFPNGRFLTQASGTDECFEVDYEIGSIVDRWDVDEFVAAGRRHDLAGPVDDVRGLAETTVVLADDRRALCGFDADGTLLWEREGRRQWLLGANDERIVVYPEAGRVPMSKCVFELDHRTGRVTRPIRAPDRVAEDVMDSDWAEDAT